MTGPHKFLFDQSFDLPEAKRGPAPRKAPPPPPEPTFSKAELEAARAAAAAAARTAALAEAAESVEARVSAALSSLALSMKVMLAMRQRYAEDAQRQALETLRPIIAKVVPALSRKAPLLEIETMVADCMREAFDEPRFVLRIAEGLFEPMQQRLARFIEAAGFTGKVVLLSDDKLGPGDARVEWAEGGAERDERRTLHDIDEALARALASITVPGTSPPKENGHE